MRAAEVAASDRRDGLRVLAEVEGYGDSGAGVVLSSAGEGGPLYVSVTTGGEVLWQSISSEAALVLAKAILREVWL